MNRKRHYKLIWLLASGGFVSALLSIGVSYYPIWLHAFGYFPGVAFGVIVAACFTLCGHLRSVWKALAIPAASTLAYYASIQAGGAVVLHSPFHFLKHGNGTVPILALFVAGLTGAFLILAVTLVLLDSVITRRNRLFNSLCWAPLGGLLGIVGWALGPSLGITLWSGAHSAGLTPPGETLQNALQGQSSHVCSLLAVWQTGMGFVLGLAARDSVLSSRTSVGRDLHKEVSLPKQSGAFMENTLHAVVLVFNCCVVNLFHC